MSARMPHARSRRAGFTMVEVLIAVLVLTLAVMGGSSLQSASSRANVTARHRNHAVDFLQTWLERVKLDGMAWQTPEAQPSLFVGRTDNAWFHLTDSDTALNGVGTMAADFWGNDIADAAAGAALRRVRFCVDLRGQILSTMPQTMRADVRVWWHREGVSALNTADADHRLSNGCDMGATDITADARVNFIDASVLLERQ